MSRESSEDIVLARVGLDPQIAEIVAARGLAAEPDLAAMPIDEALKLVRFPMNAPPPPNSEDRTIEPEPGRRLRIRLYYPEGERNGLPLLMHFHGGGFVTGTIEMDDRRCVVLARDAGCIVASVDYSLAPEHPFPAAIEDAFAVWTWLAEAARDLGGDPSRMAVSGSSAGGHVAIGLCLLARERAASMPVLQLLTYPVVDPALDTGSYADFAEGPFLSRRRMAWFWDQYRAGQSPEGPLWAPLSGSLAGLPPAHVITAGFDVLRDEAESYAAALIAQGGKATVRRHEGMIHGFIAVAPEHRETALALAEIAEVLRNTFTQAND